MPKRTVEINTKVKVPADLNISDAKVRELFEMMLDVGYEDAVDSSDNPDIDNSDADLVLKLEFGTPKIVKLKAK